MFNVSLDQRTRTTSPKMSRSRCVACHIQEPGMIAIYQHPRGVDRIWTYVTGIIVKARDQLCIPCYDELRISHRFKEKCIHNNISRLGRMAKQHGLPRTQLDPPSSDDSLATSEPDDPGLHLELSHRQAEECLQQLAPLGTDFVIKNEPIQDQLPDELSGIEQSSYTLSLLHHPQQPQQHHQQSAETNHNSSHDDALDVIKMAVELSPEDIGLRAVPLSSESGGDDDDDDDEEHHEVQERQKQRPSNGRDSLPTVKCSLCDQTFTSGALLKQHMHKEHGQTPNGRVRRDNTNAVKFRRMLSGKINALMCRYCYREFDSADTKTAHEKTHLTDPKPFQCSFTDCNRLFQHRSALNRHFYTHVTPKRFKCSVCPKRFHQQSSMVVHERLHRGDRPHICPQCGKGFTHLSNVKRHIRFHNGEKPYECAQCPARFTTSTDLRRHMNSRRCLSRSLKSK